MTLWMWTACDDDAVGGAPFATAEEATAAAVDHYDEEWDEDGARRKHSVIISRCVAIDAPKFLAERLNLGHVLDELGEEGSYDMLDEVPLTGTREAAEKDLREAVTAWAKKHLAVLHEGVGVGEEVEV